ncbi:MAG: hypothetical protein R6T98_13500, partial [Desulfatiglandales bacterium]
ELKQGTTANTRGDYELKLPPGKYMLICQSLGYEPLFAEIILTDQDVTRDFVLPAPNNFNMHLADVAGAVGIHKFQEHCPDGNVCHLAPPLTQAARTQGWGLAARIPQSQPGLCEETAPRRIHIWRSQTPMDIMAVRYPAHQSRR